MFFPEQFVYVSIEFKAVVNWHTIHTSTNKDFQTSISIVTYNIKFVFELLQI